MDRDPCAARGEASAFPEAGDVSREVLDEELAEIIHALARLAAVRDTRSPEGREEP